MKIDKERHSASHIRPLKMLNAFKNIGYEVELIDGYGKERKDKIRNIKQNIKAGIKYDFLYSESSTMPTLLTEKHHIPTYPFLDFSFFSFCKRNNIPIGLFYRDIYWCFKDYYTSPSRYIARLFYMYDIIKYNRLLNVLFIPSLEMIKYIPIKIKPKTYSLPSGSTITSNNKKILNQDKSLIEVLYIGGIGHAYDIKMFTDVISSLKKYHFTICCREEEWELEKASYANYINSNGNITIIHESGEQLDKLYNNADLFCLFIKPSSYTEFSVPYKLFEAIGNCCPIITAHGTWFSSFCNKHQIGPSCVYDYNALKNLLEKLSRDDLLRYKKNLKGIMPQHTWEHRCIEVKEQLIK